MRHPDWLLIANATLARVFAHASGEAPHLVRTFEHPAGRLKTAQLGSSKAGREVSGHGFGGAAFEPRSDAHRREHLRFAHEVTEFLEHEAKAETFGALYMFAPDPFLGHLRESLGPACMKRLGASRAIDLSHVGPAELPKRIELALAAGLGHHA